MFREGNPLAFLERDRRDSIPSHTNAANRGTRLTIKALFIDNDPLAAGALKLILHEVPDVEVIACEAGLDEAIIACDGISPDVVVIDLYLQPGEPDGISLGTAIKTRHPSLPVMICTSSDSPQDATRAWIAGMDGFVTKKEFLCKAERIATLLKVVSEGFVMFRVDPRGATETPNQLSDRELEVLGLKFAGHAHRYIATEMCISVKTVDSHLANIRAKLGVETVEDALRVAVERGLLVGR